MNVSQTFICRQDAREVAIAGGIVTGIKKHFLGSQFYAENQKNYYDINCVAFLQAKNEVPRLLSYSVVLPASLPEASFIEELRKVCEAECVILKILTSPTICSSEKR